MFHSPRSRIATAASICAMALGAGASSASAQGPVVTGGLVNVTLTDVVDVNNNQVIAQVPIGVAANVCDVSVLQVLSGEVDATNCQAQNNQLPRAFQAR
jgi:hypothetical protein